MVQLTVRITAASGSAHQLVHALHTLMRWAQQSAGCSAAHITPDVDQTNVFWYLEDWQNPQALDRRVRSEQFSQLLALMETSAAPPSLVEPDGESAF